MAYCSSCGSLLGAGNKSCRTCSHPVGGVSKGRPEPPAEATRTPRRAWPFKADRLDKVVALIVGVALLITVLIVLVQFFLGFLEGFFGAL
jgi:uncharacterized membrane protein YvbJ